MNARIAELHNKVFSTPQGSREREQAINSLSDSEKIGRASCRERV